MDPSDPFGDYWFRAAVSSVGVMSATRIYSPRSTVRIGHEAGNDFIVPVDVGIGSFAVVSDGTTLNLLPGGEVRTAASGVRGASVWRYTGDGSKFKVCAEKVNVCIAPRLSLFLHYMPTREMLEQFIDRHYGE